MALYRNIWLFVLLGLAGCKSTQPVTADQLSKRIRTKLGQAAHQADNFDHTLVLAWADDTRSGIRIVRFGVWDKATGKLVYAGSGVNGKVEWLDNNHLLLEDYRGIADGDHQQYKYKIDLTTQTKIPLDEIQEH